MSCEQKPPCPPNNPPIKRPEIDCLKVKKVFEEVSRTFVAKVKIPVKPAHPGYKVECGHAHITPKHLECMVMPDCSKVMLLQDEVMVHVHANLIHDNMMHPVMAKGKLVIPENEKCFVLDRAGEHGLDCEVDIFAECIECSITCKSHEDMVSEIICCIGVLIIVKLVAEVDLLVPTFGYCPVPPKSEEKTICPPAYNPTAIPFPPQLKKEKCEPDECHHDHCHQDDCPPTPCPPKPPKKCMVDTCCDMEGMIDLIL